ncbi:hypothetical protein SAMN05421853_102105 [Roseivivax halotolerans]|uniref:Uncharacterized protein n=1 Tax=Roseivivax halotolerans TaxID=93684 RepID=A0A1I5W3L9_9RHOB|nr:hypothetical protein [Roseivivax halotolerans]SFQ14325.1 hypothetical protein SAMN05421853_102105 [Roseivivax halotolerans]
MQHFVITAVARMPEQTTLCRCGRVFSTSGTVVALGEFENDEWKRLEADKYLHIREARDDEVAAQAVTAEPLDAEAAAELAERLDEVIRALEPGDFGQDGKPKITAIRKWLPEEKDRIDATLRDAVWKLMTEGGFEAPKA